MNVYLNGNLAQMPVVQFDGLITPRKKATLPSSSTLFCLVSNIVVRIFGLQTCKQSNSLTTTMCKHIKAEHKHIYKCYILSHLL